MSGAASNAGAPGQAPEEMARANIYGLIGRLFYVAPDQQMLSELVHTPDGPEPAEALTARGREHVESWASVVEACRSAFPILLENEHTELFAAPGKAPVTPYLMHYVIRYESETPLVALREQLLRWGLGRRAGAVEPEDHICALCEVMRVAIAVQQRSLQEQKTFFERFLYRGAIGFCDAVSVSPNANFYRRLARFAKAFFELENEAFLNL